MKKHGSFWIKESAARDLLNHRVSAEILCTYLTLARFTDRDNAYSLAGVQAVIKCCGIGKTKAEQAISYLYENDYLITADTLINNCYNFDDKKRFKHIIRDSVIFHSEDNVIWFSNELVGDNKQSNKPLLSLFTHKDAAMAARTLLYLYVIYDSSSNVCNGNYIFCDAVEEGSLIINEVNIFYGTVFDEYKFDYDFCKAITGTDDDTLKKISDDKKEELRIRVRKCLKHLYLCGLIDQVIAVAASHDISKPVYELDVKKGDNAYHSTEERNCFIIEPVLRTVGISCARGNSTDGNRLQFRNKYAGLLHETSTGKLMRYVRPRHIVLNPSNASAKQIDSAKGSSRAMLQQLISRLRTSVNSENQMD